MILQYVGALSQKRIILASASPRRRELLSRLGLQFEVIASDFEELLPHEDFPMAADYAVETARQKCLDVVRICAQRAEDGKPLPDLIISADTVVELGGKILEKPDDADHAFLMLKSLSGSLHHVHTGVVLALPNRRPQQDRQPAAAANGSSTAEVASTSGAGSEPYIHAFSCTTDVIFDELQPELIRAYIESGEPFGKAGAYGIQGLAGSFVRSIAGDYYNVVGFPVHRFSKELLALIHEGYLPLANGPVAGGDGLSDAAKAAKQQSA